MLFHVMKTADILGLSIYILDTFHYVQIYKAAFELRQCTTGIPRKIGLRNDK